MPDETPKHSVSVAGIVVDDQDRVLVIKRRDNGHWEPPGGVLELGETFEEGVKREVLEETGISVEVERLTGAYKNMNQGIVALVFRCRPDDYVHVKSSDEAESVRWVELDLATELMSEAYGVRVRDAFSASNARARAHDGVNLEG
jgi:8-oxo-dGTP diphosphatase